MFWCRQIRDDGTPPQKVEGNESGESSSHFHSSEPENSDSGYSPDKAHLPVTVHSLKVESPNDVSSRYLFLNTI